MTIYRDHIAESLGLRPLKELVPEYEYTLSVPDDASHTHYSGELNPFYGQKHTEDTKRIIAETNKRVHTGRKRSQATRSKMSDSQKGKRVSQETKLKLSELNNGKKLSSETKEKMSKSRKGVSKNEIHKNKIKDANKGMRWTCNHCGVEGGHGIFRWHFDNCKHNPINLPLFI